MLSRVREHCAASSWGVDGLSYKRTSSPLASPGISTENARKDASCMTFAHTGWFGVYIEYFGCEGRSLRVADVGAMFIFGFWVFAGLFDFWCCR